MDPDQPFPGHLVAFQEAHLLLHGPAAADFGAPVWGPPVFLRPGYRFWRRPTHFIPEQVVDDFGQVFAGAEAYDFIEMRGDAYPRADVIGRAPGGPIETVFMKELDLPEMAVFAACATYQADWRRVSLALEARSAAGPLALEPAPFPLAVLARGLPAYRLAPETFGPLGQAIVSRLLASGHRQWRLTTAELAALK